jgi:hypothetical protein
VVSRWATACLQAVLALPPPTQRPCTYRGRDCTRDVLSTHASSAQRPALRLIERMPIFAGYILREMSSPLTTGPPCQINGHTRCRYHSRATHSHEVSSFDNGLTTASVDHSCSCQVMVFMVLWRQKLLEKHSEPRRRRKGSASVPCSHAWDTSAEIFVNDAVSHATMIARYPDFTRAAGLWILRPHI